jgi:hypothetical protein
MGGGGSWIAYGFKKKKKKKKKKTWNAWGAILILKRIESSMSGVI